MFARARFLVCTILNAPTYKRPVLYPRLTIAVDSKGITTKKPETIKGNVIHDPLTKEFYIEFANYRASLFYEIEGNVIKIMDTQVPKQLERKGYGKALAQAVLKHIEKNKLRAEAYCMYFLYYVENYEPKYLKYFEN